MQELNHQSLDSLIRKNFPTISQEHTFKYFDDEGDLCTLTESTFTDWMTCLSKSSEAESTKLPSTERTEQGAEAKQEIEPEPTVIRLFICEKVAVPTCDEETLREFANEHVTEYEVAPRGLSKQQPRKQRGQVHFGITCDCCDASPITGFRYKCNVCDDFDMCEGCYEKPMSTEMAQHVANHDFIQMSALDTLRKNRPSPIQTERAAAPPMTLEELESPLTPRTGAEWTSVSIGTPHVEGLLRAFGVDVDRAKEEVNKFISTGDFQGILEHVKQLRSSGQNPEGQGGQSRFMSSTATSTQG
jgi:hypothetical protein